MADTNGPLAVNLVESAWVAGGALITVGLAIVVCCWSVHELRELRRRSSRAPPPPPAMDETEPPALDETE